MAEGRPDEGETLQAALNLALRTMAILEAMVPFQLLGRSTR
jgi:hypothetical protein